MEALEEKLRPPERVTLSSCRFELVQAPKAGLGREQVCTILCFSCEHYAILAKHLKEILEEENMINESYIKNDIQFIDSSNDDQKKNPVSAALGQMA